MVNGYERFLSVDFTKGIDVDSMYGIEIEEFPCRVAETALYLMDHLMNVKESEEFGENYFRLPLKRTPHIKRANALRIDWREIVKPDRLTCIVGNPPFIGKKARSKEQVEDMDIVFGKWDGHGELDYVSAWYVKAMRYITGTTVPVAFVSTNSLTQGEQVSIFWPPLIREGVKIQFAHRTFQWTNDAPGQAGVYCVVIRWGLNNPNQCVIFDYATPKSDPLARTAKRINSYLVDFDDVFLEARRMPLFQSPPITFGSMPNDDGNFLFDSDEYTAFVENEPGAKDLLRPILTAKEFLHNIPRWCLWLKDSPPSVIRNLKSVKERVENVRKYRMASTRPATRKLADTPTLFGEIRQPSKRYILIPRHSSEHRQFIPMAFVEPSIIVGDSCVVVHSEDLFVLGVLQSTMHMAWVRHICGRLESRYRYSNEIVYNNFPWPTGAGPTHQNLPGFRYESESADAVQLKTKKPGT